MELGAVLNHMRDPAGIPTPPIVFQVLFVVTWALHIAFVNLTLGGAAMAIWGFLKRQDPLWARLSVTMTNVAKVSVSLAIVLGVAPLLFTQVIYDPMWYTSNVLSAAWAITFIFTLGIGYTLWFVFYYRNIGQKASSGTLGWALAALALLLLDGFIMHVLAYQSISPQKWLSWYSPGGIPDMSGTGIHGFELPRYFFFLAMSVVMAGLFLLGYADYFSVREKSHPRDYLDFCRDKGISWAKAGLVVQLFFGLWWMTEIRHLGAISHPLTWLTVAALLLLLGFVFSSGKNLGRGKGVLALGLFGLMDILVSLDREAIRIAILKPLGYDPMTYRVSWDVASTALFFLTFLGVGGLVVGFMLAMLWQAGRTEGTYTAKGLVAQLGTWSVAITALWVVIFFLVGLAVWLGNYSI